MEPTFVTVSEARKLTGKSERTIRRFLKSYVTEKSQHFQPDTQNGKSIWLIDSDFLNEHYEFKSTGEIGRGVAGDNDTVKSRDNKGLMDKWQQEAEKQRDMSRESAGHSVSDGSDNGFNNQDDGDNNMTNSKNGMSPDAPNDQAWKLIKKLQEQIEKKDEQLDRYYTQQTEMMTTMGRLMEQEHLLLARSQENPAIANPNDRTNESSETKPDGGVIIVDAETPLEDKSSEEVLQTKPSDEAKSETPKKSKFWSGLFSG